MRIFIDSDFKCHVSDDGTRRAFDVQFFDGMCAAFIEGYRYVPKGERWIKPNGVFYRGEMISPWKPYSELELAQNLYEKDKQIEELNNQLTDTQLALCDVYEMITTII